LLESVGSVGAAVAGANEPVSVGRNGTVRNGKSRGVVTVQGVEGVFAKGSSEREEVGE
jgi:hypothetical protein